MATCPDCGAKGTTFVLEPALLYTGPAFVAGVQAKVGATSAARLTCEPARGGCGFTVVGVVRDGYLEVPPPPAEPLNAEAV